ncbi:uncharacterized protein KIAA2026 isoform X2 [Gouania willdenowi]|uniref:Bromo domain-containing protein n=1 Tax=Gouania willdenowi TaxID=441366 RepID=A0A8C5DQA6_GOUWI|nr:uncharacterized protein KIAA2026 homolog isoform X2 [Gouania willdenowi]
MASRLKELSSSTEDDEMRTVIVNGLCNYASATEVGGDVATEGDSLSLSNDSMSEVSLPEVCVSTNGSTSEEDTNYEVQQAYRIFTGFLLDKYKGITNPFLHPVGHQEAQHGVRGVKARGQSQLRQSICLQKIEKKFISHEYETITEFVTDFRLMLENCYRYHGVDHWVSKQAQKLERMLEQKLTLLSRTLREKTTLAVTSKGHFGAEEDRGSGGTSLRRRLAPRSIATLTVGGHESIMVQALRLEEQQRAKEEKKQRELEKKEAEEMSAKEVDEWEQSLLSQAHPQTVDTLWELPAIGHFLCLAQRALNLPEVVFFELERCLLMPRCSMLLSKIMSSLLSPPHRRASLHRQPPLPYHRWESELRQVVRGWYRIVGSAHDQPGRAQKLGLCHQFFTILGEVSPMEEKPFHMLLFHQRVWLLKGLCDHVYETHKDVQDAVLAQPIHECRESILGYDHKDNSYIHFPHFCGADLRIYCQSPSPPPVFPFPLVWVKRFEGTEKKETNAIKEEGDKNDREYQNIPKGVREYDKLERQNETHLVAKKEKMNIKEDKNTFKTWCLMKTEVSSDSDSCGDSEVVLKMKSSSSFQMPIGGVCAIVSQEETLNGVHGPEGFTSEQGLSLGSVRSIKTDTKDPCLNVGEHSYTGRSPARSMTLASSVKSPVPEMGKTTSCEGHEEQALLNNSKTSSYECEEHLSSENTLYPSEEIAKVGTEKKRMKKKRARVEHKQLQHTDSTRLSPAEAAQSASRKKEKKKDKTEKKLESSNKVKDEPTVEPSFKLVCANLEDLRQLISKTEDELDDLESTKKRLGRWYYKKEAVKELHNTLIRLLNELSPWEPKLVKAYQRNRLRLKKEFDDFKNHPEYNNFVREEYMSSSSSDDDDEEEDEEKAKQFCSAPYDFKQYEEDDQEFSVPRGLWSGGRSREIVAEQLETHVPSNYLNEQATQARDETISSVHNSEDSRFGAETIPQNKSRDSEEAAGMAALILPKSFLSRSTIGLHKRYTPIPTLLAKSVGNKVTLMKQPVDCPDISSANVFSKGPALSLPCPAAGVTKVSDVPSPPSCSQSFQQKSQEETLKSQLLGQNEMTTMTMAFPKLTQAKPTQTESKSPIQVIYRTPEGLGQLVVKDSPMKFSVHPVVDKNTVKKTQQVVILPSKLLTQKTEEKNPYLPPLQSKSMESNGNVTSLIISTDAPGFSIPEDKSSVSQVVPLKDEQNCPSPILPYLQQGSLNSTAFRGSQACNVQPTKSQVVMPTPSQNSVSVLSDPVKTEDHKQELRTVCIRDSQSILVTTRCGNTGIVKVQTSSDQNRPGSFPTTPVITISPQLKAYLVSKTATLSKSSPSQTHSSTIPTLISNPVAHSHQQPPAEMTLPFTAPSPSCTTITSNSPTTKPALPPSHDLNTQASLNPTNISQLAKTASLGSFNPASMFKKMVDLPSYNSTSVRQVLKQDLTRKTGRKRACKDEGAQVTKFLLVTPNSPSSPNKARTKGIPSPAKAVTSSRVLEVDQTLAKSSIISMRTEMSGQAMTTSLSRHSLKMGLGAGQPDTVTTEMCYKTNNITPPSEGQEHPHDRHGFEAHG